MDEFLNQLRIIIDDEECDLIRIDSIILAKDLYKKALDRIQLDEEITLSKKV